MEIDDLIEHSGSLIWDDEESELIYSYPAPLNTDTAKNGQILSQGIPQNQIYKVGIFYAAKSPQTHIGPFKWAVDFLICDKTPVYAGQNGKIIEIQEGSDTWGDGPEFRDYLNYLTIQHKNNEYSQYCHLAKGSVSKLGLKLGMKVKRGQLIAGVGKTGWTDRDHLHFIVFRDDKNSKNPYGFKSLKIRWSH